MPVTGTEAAATFTATALDAGVIVNPAGFAIATVTSSPFATVILEIASVRVVPVPVNAPFVAPVTVMSPSAKVVGSTLKFRVNTVVVTVPDVPFADKPENDTGTATEATFTATTLDAGVIVKPVGFAIATVTFAPFVTVILEIASVRVVPVPDSAPFVAPVTVTSPATKVVGLTSNVRVNSVVVTVPDAPFADKPENDTGIPVITPFVTT